MRRLALLFSIPACMLAVLFLASPVGADDAPDYTSESLIFIEADLPSGWTLLSSDETPAGLPTEDQVTEAGGDSIDPFELVVEYRVLAGPGGAKAAIAVIDVDVDGGPGAYTKGLEALATSAGGKVLALPHPQRLLFVSAPADKVDELVSWQQGVAARRLSQLAYERLLRDFHDGAPGKTSLLRGGEYADAALQLKTGMPAAKAVKGFIQIFEDDEEGGISTLRGALGANGDLAPSDRMKWFGWGLIGRTLILAKGEQKPTEAQHKDAIVAFRKALAFQDAAIAEANEINDNYLRLRVWGTRYNMCCSLAQTKQVDSALRELDACMSIGQRMLSMGNGWQRWFEHAWFWDEDLEPLRADKRFLELMKKYAPDKYDWEKQREELLKAKKKRDEERAKQAKAKDAGKKDAEKEAGGKPGADGKDG